MAGTKKIKLKLGELVDAFEMQSEILEMHSYLDRRSGKIVTISSEDIRYAEGDQVFGEPPEWQKDAIDVAKDYLEHEEHFVSLPDQFDFHEYNVMESFALSQEDEDTRESLYHSLKGKGAFRRFKGAIHRLGLADKWYKYREDALNDLLKDWCEDTDVELIIERETK